MSAAEGSFFPPWGNSRSIALTVLCDGYVYLLTPSSPVPVVSLYILRVSLFFFPLQVPNKNHRALDPLLPLEAWKVTNKFTQTALKG